MPKNKRRANSENVAAEQAERSKVKRGKGLKTGLATLSICAASFGAYYSPHFRAASSDWLERCRALIGKTSFFKVSSTENAATADEKMREKLAQAPSFRDFLTDEYGEEGARELLGVDAATDVQTVANVDGGFAGYVVAETSASEALEPQEVASGVDESLKSPIAEPGASFADYVAAENAKSQEVGPEVDEPLKSPIAEPGSSFADYVAAEEAGTPNVANEFDEMSPTSEPDANVADYAASEAALDSDADVGAVNVETTELATASVAADVSDEDETALAARLQDEMKERGVGAPRIERWGGRFWRASGFATTDEGVATFCEAVDVDPTSAQRAALAKFDAAKF